MNKAKHIFLFLDIKSILYHRKTFNTIIIELIIEERTIAEK